MFKKLIIFVFFILFQTPCFSSDIKTDIDDIINLAGFDNDSVLSISIKEKGAVPSCIYEKNPYKFLNPASTLKLFTMAAALDTLGSNFKFETVIYKDKNEDLYLKLSGDPLFKTDDMNLLAHNLKTNLKGNYKKIYIDDSVTDFVPYPNGWAADDFWPNSPKLSPYMIDFNTVGVDFYTDPSKKDIRIIQKDPYKFTFVNKLEKGNENNIRFVLDEEHKTVNVDGTLSSSIVNKEIPVINPKYFFCSKLTKTLNKNGIKYSEAFQFKKTPKDAVPVAKVTRSIDEVLKHILYTSDNTSAEMVFKVAGGKYAKEKNKISGSSLGTTQNGINMFRDFYSKLGLNPDEAKIFDGSGVSRYNATNTNWMTNALFALDFDYEKYLPTAGVGTLSKRIRELKDAAFFKTGTLYGISSIAGIIKTNGKEYCYSSIIMGFNRNSSLLKGVEDDIIYQIYRMGNNENK